MTAYLKLGGTPVVLPELESTVGLEGLLGVHLPHTSLPPLGGCHEILSHYLPGSDEYEGLCPASLGMETQYI